MIPEMTLEEIRDRQTRRRQALEDKAARADIRANTKAIERLEKSLSGSGQ